MVFVESEAHSRIPYLLIMCSFCAGSLGSVAAISSLLTSLTSTGFVAASFRRECLCRAGQAVEHRLEACHAVVRPEEANHLEAYRPEAYLGVAGLSATGSSWIRTATLGSATFQEVALRVVTAVIINLSITKQS